MTVTLYHGTAGEWAESIRRHGLRQHEDGQLPKRVARTPWGGGTCVSPRARALWARRAVGSEEPARAGQATAARGVSAPPSWRTPLPERWVCKRALGKGPPGHEKSEYPNPRAVALSNRQRPSRGHPLGGTGVRRRPAETTTPLGRRAGTSRSLRSPDDRRRVAADHRNAPAPVSAGRGRGTRR